MSRPDRDSSVEVLWQNVMEGHQKNFAIEPEIGNFFIDRDFLSP